MARLRPLVRTAASIALGAFAVHQLRYLVAYGDGANAALSAQGHGYLDAVLPLLVALAVSATLATFAAAASARRRQVTEAHAGWAFCTAALLAIFAAQESTEGLLSGGHPGGIAALIAHGGWIVLPIAVLIGRLVAWLLRGMASVDRALAGAPLRPRIRTTRDRGSVPATRALGIRWSPLAFGIARRPPPAPLS